MLYEAVLLFGVLFGAVAALYVPLSIFSNLLESRNAALLQNILEIWEFLALGLYFTWFWSHGGQTLPMKTWRIRLEAKDGRTVTLWRALFRYFCAWLWFFPGFAIAKILQAQLPILALCLAINFVLWAATILFGKDRQFLHDNLAGTHLIDAATSNPLDSQ